MAIPFYGRSQDVEQCRQLLTELRILNTTSDLEKSNQVYFVDYSVKVVEKKATKEPLENRLKVFGDYYHRHVIMKEMEVYVDTLLSITILKRNKTIIINAIDSETKEAMKKSSISSVQDSVLTSSYEILSCKTVTGLKEYDKEIEIKPKSNMAKIRKVHYFINESQKQIYKVIMHHVENNPFKTTEYTFYTVDYKYLYKKVNYPVSELVFTKEGSLVPAYKGYHVVDNKKSKALNK